jgi:hypothetical protein
MTIEAIVAMVSMLISLSGYFEWRVRAVQSRMLDKIKDREEVTQVRVNDLKENLIRLESKVDMLLKLQIHGVKDDGRESRQ